MTQAVEDGATRPVYYESRVVHLNLDAEILKLIDAEYDLMAQNAEPYAIEKSKKELGKMEAILGADQTLNSLVDDILEHYDGSPSVFADRQSHDSGLYTLHCHEDLPQNTGTAS
mgnify:CR=1 FL=1